MPVPGGPPGFIAPNGTLTSRRPTWGDTHKQYGQGTLRHQAALMWRLGSNFTRTRRTFSPAGTIFRGGSSSTTTLRPVKRVPVPMVSETLIVQQRRKYTPGATVTVTHHIPGRRHSVPVVTDNLIVQRRLSRVPDVTTTTVIPGRRLSVPVVSDNIVFQRGKSKISVQIVNVAHLVPGRRYAYPVYGDELFTSE